MYPPVETCYDIFGVWPFTSNNVGLSASNGCIEDANMFTFHLTFTRNSYNTKTNAVEDEESPNLEFFAGIKIDEKEKEKVKIKRTRSDINHFK